MSQEEKKKRRKAVVPLLLLKISLVEFSLSQRLAAQTQGRYQRTVVADSQTVCEVQRLPLRTVQQMRSGLARKV
ncbi:GTP cyclohydrolase III [Dissostichus eleginoides]|uniref:GTP cyclohydrolase III n=1 Tax=Dissostichus eleginoides TaxID=100907 RepID=A0AAD9ETI2_DISEL|nr:GTP cyclohydrolase III [Dissostichus eleginoides]